MPTLRPANPDDLKALAELCHSYDVAELGQPEMEAGDIRAIATDTGDSLLVEDDGRVVGFADAADSGEIETVVWSPQPELQRELLAWAALTAAARRAGAGAARLRRDVSAATAGRSRSGRCSRSARSATRCARTTTTPGGGCDDRAAGRRGARDVGQERACGRRTVLTVPNAPSVSLRPRTDDDLDLLFEIAADLETWEERGPQAPRPLTRDRFDARLARAADGEDPGAGVSFVIDVDGAAGPVAALLRRELPRR